MRVLRRKTARHTRPFYNARILTRRIEFLAFDAEFACRLRVVRGRIYAVLAIKVDRTS